MYKIDFYAEQSADSRRAAAAAVPLVMRLINPRSVLDIGCGVGTWLAEFAVLGIADYLGIDGDYVPRDRLQIPPSKFLARDIAAPFDLGRTFDLAISLEVAEHLPRESAPDFIALLTSAAPVVLFSAAVPGQGGTGHVNEQWPEYWRALFRRHGYVAVDAIRPLVWGNSAVVWWYQQNMLLYCRQDVMAGRSDLTAVPEGRSLNVVHPTLFDAHRNRGIGDVARLTARALLRRMRLFSVRRLPRRAGGK